MPEWREVNVDILTQEGVRARRGLVHRSKGAGLIVVNFGQHGYSVTHAASGKAITRARSLSLAKRLLLAIAPLARWTDDDVRLGKQRALGTRVSEAINSATAVEAVA